MARIMFMGNAPWCGTGYGVQGKHLVPRLKALGHEMAYFAFYGLEAGIIQWDGYRVYPKGIKTWGNDVLLRHLQNFKADALVTLLDLWVFQGMGDSLAEHGFKWLPWVPIDTDPLAPPILTATAGATAILPISRFGERLLSQAGVLNVRYVPHGVSDVYTPGDRAASRKIIGIPEDVFVVGMVAANKGFPSRKAIPEQLLAFSHFHRRHPKSMFYIHTLVTQDYGGVDVVDIARQLGITESVRWSDQYAYLMGFSEPSMAHLYRSFDVLSCVSDSEGFGIPIVESQACGTPVIVNDSTAMPELCFNGLVVKGNRPAWSPIQSWVYPPDPDAILDAYEAMYERLADPNEARRTSEEAMEAASDFRWDKLIDQYWQPLIEEFLP